MFLLCASEFGLVLGWDGLGVTDAGLRAWSLHPTSRACQDEFLTTYTLGS